MKKRKIKKKKKKKENEMSTFIYVSYKIQINVKRLPLHNNQKTFDEIKQKIKTKLNFYAN